MGRPPKENAELTTARKTIMQYTARIRELEDENVALRKQHDRQQERYQKLIDKTVELVFGDLRND